jgi:hypothetical protein
VVSNENAGMPKQIADDLAAAGMACAPTFHVPVPGAKLARRRVAGGRAARRVAFGLIH